MLNEFLDKHFAHILATLILFIVYPAVRYLIKKITLKYYKSYSFNYLRTKMVLKYMYGFINVAAIILLITIWGVDTSNILVTLSGVFAVIGVAMFAQWSVLSNITSGIILFFSTPIKIGDKIKILDKDFPVVAYIEDIKMFYIHLRTEEGEKIIFPNNQLLQKGITIFPPDDHPDNEPYYEF